MVFLASLGPSVQAQGQVQPSDPPEGIFRPQAPLRLSAEFYDAEGHVLSVAGLDAGIVVLNFWATWCGPCIEELPTLGALREAIRGDGVEVVALSVDRGGVPETERFFARYGRPNLVFGYDPRSRNLEQMEVTALPFTAVISPDGNVIALSESALDWNDPEIVAWLRTLIAAES